MVHGVAVVVINGSIHVLNCSNVESKWGSSEAPIRGVGAAVAGIIISHNRIGGGVETAIASILGVPRRHARKYIGATIGVERMLQSKRMPKLMQKGVKRSSSRLHCFGSPILIGVVQRVMVGIIREIGSCQVVWTFKITGLCFDKKDVCRIRVVDLENMDVGYTRPR